MSTETLRAFDMGATDRHKKQYDQEARDKYGHSDAYRESQRRTAQYSEEDWACI